MRLNKKGITSVELLVCFIIISTIVVSMYNLILNYRNREQIEEINNEVISFSNTLQRDIQKDLINGHLVNVTSVSDDGLSATLTFDNPRNYDTSIIIKPDEGIISYSKNGDTVDYEIPGIADLMLSPDSKIEYIPATNGYLKITIVLTHPNFENGTYSFMINCPISYVYANNNPEDDNTESDKPAGDVIIDNLICDATYDDGTDTFITSSCGDPNNYVWYSGKIWRAVSVNNEAKTIKLVTQWNISAINYSSGSTDFAGSYMEEWLNDTTVDGFLGNLRDYKNFIVTDSVWNATMDATDLGSITRPSDSGTVVTDAVGLLNMYEYQSGNAGETDGYLNNKLIWWTLTPYSSSRVRYVSNDGGAYNRSPSNNSVGVRPSINLKSSVKIVDGDGTEDNPYRLEGDNDTNLSGTKLSSRYSGEYIKFGNDENNLYRIVSHENGTGTKIVSAEPLKSTGTFITMNFGSNAIFSSTNIVGSFLNGEYLTNYIDSSYSDMIEDSTTWYLGIVGSGSSYSYKNAKYTDESGTATTSNVVEAKVGLLRFGELMSGQFDRYDSNTYYWTLTPYSSLFVRYISFNGNASNDSPSSSSYGVQPSMNLKSNVVITGGDGTKNNPFTVALQ